MSDNLNQLGIDLGKIKEDIEAALRRNLPVKPIIEHVRDIFDSVIPFEMEFNVPSNTSGVTSLDLFFGLPPDVCCAGCFCAICEVYTSGNTWTTTYSYLTTSVQVIQMAPYITPYWGSEQVLVPPTGNDSDYHEFEFVNANTITSDSFTASTTFPIKICYVYRIEGCTS